MKIGKIAKTSKRELGIEILRMLAMLMIVSLHVLSGSGGGGVLKCTEPFSFNWFVAWILESIAFQSVNCFGLISGYTQFEKTWKLSGYFSFWIMVFLMNVMLFIGTAIIGWHSLTVLKVVHDSIPWLSDLWYVKAYLGLLLIIPILNIVIEKWWDEKRLYLVLSIIMIVPFLYRIDYFVISSGYSTIWLAVLYVIGGAIKKADFQEKFSVIILVIGEILLCFLVFMSKVIPDYVGFKLKGEYNEYNMWFIYISPLVLLQALCLFMLLLKNKILAPKWFVIISQSAFGVFVIHKNPIINGKFLVKASNKYAGLETGNMIVKLGLLIITVYLGSLVVSIPLTNICKLISEKLVKKTYEIYENICNRKWYEWH